MEVNNRTKKVTRCGMLIGIAIILQYIEISIPIMPSFIKLDFSDLPELIGAFAYGPFTGVLIALIKNIIHMAVSQSGFVGELSNFLLGATFAAVAGYVFQKNPTKSGILKASALGAVAMALISWPINYWIIYPLYYNVLGFPEVAILQMYQLLIPSIKSIGQALLIFNVPFTLIKGILNGVIMILIYNRIQFIFHEK
ncbi:MAG: ECF transporter S component [Absicoccus sp.]|uniref:ECF transporter S component n=1 Tax=Absicoccus sp. TaxID=2718527 RepID=UPI002A76361D|nr:ECF transporter S component [Absicoccus sp.]MDY3036390.1 ECF transporter S component [Absicoccus sp.]